MLGKTFKGLTDATLRWQTEQLLERAVARTTWQVDVRPELVAEIALDGLQVSRRYPAGVALRFARVLRYREDKTADEADTVETVLSLTAGAVSDDGAVPDDGADGTPDDVPGDARVEASTAAIGTTDPGRTDDL
ncbi:MAG: hypothetical protein U0Q15_16045 [Kineosporiaceae bacterium]